MEDEYWHIYIYAERLKKTNKHHTRSHLSHSRLTSPTALFMTTLDDMAPEEQVIHNVIPLKDKMPLWDFQMCIAKQRAA